MPTPPRKTQSPSSGTPGEGRGGGREPSGATSKHVQVTVDLGRIQSNAANIRRRTGVDLIAVVKSDAYGLGAQPVAKAIADLVAGFCVFSLEEARRASLWETTGKPVMTLGPATHIQPDEFIAARVRPAVWTADEARRLRPAKPLLCVDTGMRRFACPRNQIDSVIAAGAIDEAFTHAIRLPQAQDLASLLAGRGLRLHAAASALLDQPLAYLDAVRPGIALYRGAVRVSTPIVELHEGRSPAGYTGFITDRFGVILCGYSQGLGRGPCLVAGARRQVLEVGMQTALIEIGPNDKVGDELILLGDGLTEAELAAARGVSEQQALLFMAGAGTRTYREA
jgi:alanine racemase